MSDKIELPKKVMTENFHKQMFRYYAAKYLGLKEPDSTLYLYRICEMLRHDKKYNYLKEDLGKNYVPIMKMYGQFLKQDHKLSQIRKLMTECKDKKEFLKLLEDDLKKEATKTPMIDFSVYVVFFHLVKRTDLRNVPIPSEAILHAQDNKFPAKYEERPDFRDSGSSEDEDEDADGDDEE